MEEILKKDQYNFSVLGDNDQSLQLILLANQSVYTQIQNIIYASGKLSIRKLKQSCWNKFTQIFSSKTNFNHRLKNRNGAVEYVGLSKPTGGKIFAVNPAIIGDILCARSNTILAFTSGVQIQEKSDLMVFLQKDNWKEICGEGILYIQTAGFLTEKRLGVDEEISVAFNSLVAFSKDIKITHSSTQTSFSNLYFYDWAFVKIKGPGVIYMECTGWSRFERVKQVKKLEIIYFLLILMAGIIILMTPYRK
ncbi:unnamed protein product [Blepharisma stoltei]|uniref:Altered inheritance of mitochondria protein 24, mitochondrial n=1 Tax=Blepharisma stoltei TaxID=1481888 RepID=A0AAU9J639_9CILI|nr:unnamed protein product [Blepharisma stoltei]